MKEWMLFAMVSVAVPTATLAMVDVGQQQRPATKVGRLKVTGMTCAGCEASVRMAARSVDGVIEATVSYAKGSAEVTYDPAKTSPAAMAKAITEKSGFKAEPEAGATR